MGSSSLRHDKLRDGVGFLIICKACAPAGTPTGHWEHACRQAGVLDLPWR